MKTSQDVSVALWRVLRDESALESGRFSTPRLAPVSTALPLRCQRRVLDAVSTAVCFPAVEVRCATSLRPSWPTLPEAIRAGIVAMVKGMG